VIFVIIAVSGENDPCPSSAWILVFQSACTVIRPDWVLGWRHVLISLVDPLSIYRT